MERAIEQPANATALCHVLVLRLGALVLFFLVSVVFDEDRAFERAADGILFSIAVSTGSHCEPIGRRGV